MRAVIIDNGVVVGIENIAEGYKDPNGRIVVASDTAGIGWLYDGKTLTVPPDPTPSTNDLMLYAQRKQSSLVNAGITVNVGASGSPAIPVLASTNDTGRIDILGLYTKAKENTAFTTLWQQSTGSLTLNAAQVIQVGDAVFEFYSATFTTLVNTEASINVGAQNPSAAGAITTFSQIDAAAWPAVSV